MHSRLTVALLITTLFPPHPSTAAAPTSPPPQFKYLEMCDASAGVALNATTFAVANDEDNVIRTYPAGRDSFPLARLDLNRFLRVEQEKKPETDFEGATWLDNKIFWITSHGRNKDAKYRASRHRLFATLVDTNGPLPRLSATGQPYTFLLHDLTSAPQLRQFNLLLASTRAPKSPGALNIEGLCSTPTGALLIGFRNPVPDGDALLVPLLNPSQIILGQHSARLGDPILLDLAGRGIRDIAPWDGGYLIIAGRFGGGGKSRLYYWNGANRQPVRIKRLDLGGLNPEAIIPYPGAGNRIQLLSDDGTAKVGGVNCKELGNVAARSFRSIWIPTEQLNLTR